MFQKEHEQRRRRKSKAQFFEMIQEIRRYRNMLLSTLTAMPDRYSFYNQLTHYTLITA